MIARRRPQLGSGVRFMTEILMALGPFRFCLAYAPYDRLRRSVQYRWPRIERAGRRSAAQFTGIGDETVELSGTFYPGYSGGLGQIDTLRAYAGQGQPYILSDGRGRIWGKFVIESAEETQTVFFADGTPRKIEFTLKLLHYGEDR